MDKKVVNLFFLNSSTKCIEHLLANLKFLLLSMSSTRIFPLAAAEAGKHALVGAFDFLIAFDKSS